MPSDVAESGGRPGREERPASSNLAKASVLRGYLAQLEKSGQLGAVRARVSASTRALMDAPPQVTQWIDAGALEDLYEALGALEGAAGVRRMVREAILASILPYVRPILQGILRVFGATPGALFARADLAFRSTLQGVTVQFTQGSENAGVVVVRYAAHRAPPMAFAAWQGTLEVGFSLCGSTGSIKLVEVIDGGAAARFDVQWG
jgi:hypothetical protein